MTNRVIHGDCLEVPLPPNHFDTLISDPPYGLSFMGKEWDNGVPGTRFWKKFLDACKPGAFAFVFGGTRTYHRLTCAIEDAGWEIRDCLMWLYGSGFPKSLDIGKAIQKTKGIEPTFIEPASGVGFMKPDSEDWHVTKNKLTMPKPEGLAKTWDGYGTALKPAWEPIIVAMKPLDGTFAQNAEKWGVGGLWIDGGRIGTETIPAQKRDKAVNTNFMSGNITQEHQGRWPSNLIMDEEAGAILDEQSGVGKSTKSQRGAINIGQLAGLSGKQPNKQGKSTERGHNDSGGASRFFKSIQGEAALRFKYCPKASKKERDAGCEDLEEKKKWLAGGTGTGISARESVTSRNNHPTVKPLALMEYLCKLSRPPRGGIVLDPFAGSGTTALACMNTDRQYVVIEKEREYCEIIAARLGGVEIETALPVSKPHSTDVQEQVKVQGCSPVPHESPSPNAEPGKASVVPPQQPRCSHCGGSLHEVGANWLCLKCKKMYRRPQ